MKKRILLIIALPIAFSANAQPVITSAQLMTTFTDTLSFLSTGMSGPGPAGPNVTWDFSGLSTSSVKSAVVAGDCPGVAVCSDFPGANTYSKHTFLSTTGGYTYAMAKKTPLKLETIGAQSEGQPPITYANPKTEYEFPLSYGQTFSDTYAWSGSGGASSGKLDYTIDAYGTVSTPLGVFNNVLRKKMVQRDTTSSGGATVVSESVIYTWLRAGQPGLVLYYLESTLLAPVPQPTQISIVYGDNPPATVTGIGEQLLANELITTYPNPANGAGFKVSVKKCTITRLELTDMTGRIVYRRLFSGNSGLQEYTIPPVATFAGMYLLNIDTDKGHGVKKITIVP
ncbi:T9SS type A sorting domain-containing protein [Taibaiella koreensis]|uniref:T9SS type A sorting domain-containing protein n=1 Tax=Taibaiella koreensis TaxID=1268548 RepID=UPI000E59BD00|nr:T9SS type A sorting domain-containing protein [Taibaiella koreensis]